MLNVLRIRNFQSHQDSVIELGPGVNVIVGPSNAGKSACVRSVNWALTNRPLGVNFIRTGQDEADVLLEEIRSNGTKVSVERIRSKSRNEYILNGDTEHPFTAFGSNPPEDVLLALNLQDSNIQGQFDPYFLVFDSPGSVALQIRKVTGMEQIDKVADIISSRIRSCRGSTSDKEADLIQIQEKLDAISTIDLEKFESLINKAETLEARKEELERNHQRLKSLSDQLVTVEKLKIHLPEARVKQINESVTRMSGDLLRLRSSQRALQALIKDLKSTASYQVVFPVNLNEVLGRRTTLVQQYNSLCTNLQNLYKIVELLGKCTTEGQGVVEKLIQLENEKGDLMSQLKTCPWCNSELTEEAQKHLLEHTNERK